MAVALSKRAEVALRSLSQIELKRALKALEELERQSRDEGRFRDVSRVNLGSEKLFAYKASERLRLIFSLVEGRVLVEDVLNPDQYQRMVGRKA
jgi:mRNA-degrading endonuclease RelE of RelBE toxin-antitoxin system